MRADASSVVRLNRLSRSMLMALQRDELAVQMRLAAPNTEALPATCSLTMSRSTAMPAEGDARGSSVVRCRAEEGQADGHAREWS